MKRTKVALLGLLLVLGLAVQATTAQFLPTDARAFNSPRVPLLVEKRDKLLPLVEQVGAVGMTVSDMDAAVDFYTKVLSFEKVADVEVRWPSGLEEKFKAVPADQILVLKEGSGIVTGTAWSKAFTSSKT